MKHFYKKWKKEIQNKFLAAIGVGVLMISTFSQGNAQVNAYAFSAFSGTYTSLVGATQSSLALTVDGGMSTTIPIGFTFVYNGISYTDVRLSADGFLVFGTAGTTTLTNNLATTTLTQRPGLAPLWDDLQATEGVKYQTNGVAPNRTFTAEWQNMEWNWSSNVTAISFQVILYETSNIIDFVYRQETNPGNPSGSGGASIGIMGATPTDYISLQNTSASPTTSTTTSTNALSVKPATNQVYRFAGPPPTPPTPTQDAAIPSCATGTSIDVTGTPDTDVQWYWQATASGTSMTVPYAGPYTVFANGTYYLRAYSTVTLAWSNNSSSIVISNFPLATTPPAPTADITPACVTTGSVLTAAMAGAGYEYYWQGTNASGVSNALPATSTYTVNTTGTYYLAAYETASQCWSTTSSIAVSINSNIPMNPVANPTEFYACTNTPSLMINAVNPMISTSLATTQAGGNGCTNGNMLDITTNSNPVTITGLTVTPNATSTQNVVVYYKSGTYVGSETNAGAWTLVGTYSITGTTGVPMMVDIDDFTIPSGSIYGIYINYNAAYSNINGSYSDSYMTITTGAGFCTAFSGPIATRTFNGAIHYLIPSASGLTWYDAATGGNSLGAGSPFEVVGTSVLPTTATAGQYSFFAEADAGGCASIARAEVLVNIAPVVVTIDPIDVSCNNGNNGSFAISTINCGNAPFAFSVDGGTFAVAPTNLTVGTYTVVVRDGGMNLSAPYTVVIGDAPAPSGLVINTFNSSSVDLSWLAGDAETSWNIEWGTPGFTPGTGSELGADIATDTNFLVTGLDGNTEYEFYISANCGGTSVTGDWISITETTLCNPLVAQGFCENFASDSNTEACWSVINANGDIDAWDMNYTVNPFSGNQVAMLYTDFNAGNNDDWLITPGLMLTNNEIMSFNYRVQSAGEPNDFEVLLSTTGTNPADFTNTLMSLNSYNNIVYQDTAINLSAYSGTCYIAFHVPSGGLDGWRLYIDQVCVDICTPAPGIDGTVDVCRLDGSLDLNTVITQGENNGVWQFTPNASALTGSDLNVSAIPDGLFTAQYIVTTACTMDTTVATLNIYPASSAGTNGQINVCKNQPVNLLAGLSGLVDHGGTWYNPSNAALSSGQITSGALPGQFNYNYITSNGVCPNDTANVILNISATCDWTGIEELNSAAITVYPNPSTGLFYISNSDASQNFNYEVLDLNGRVISENTKEVNGSATIEVDLTNVENGIYMIKLFNESGAKLVRVVKQ